MGKKQIFLPDPSASVLDALIMQHITPQTRVIDLGCGDGRLLCLLRDERSCSVQGVELDIAAIAGTITRGVPVLRANLDQPLVAIPDNSFDSAVLSQTLQQVRHPKLVLTEMLRIARRALVVVPNFGHWKIRQQILLHGRAPITQSLPYEWYNTPNLHFMSMHDFRDLTEKLDVKIVREIPIINGRACERAFAANVRAESLFYVLERSQPASARPVV